MDDRLSELEKRETVVEKVELKKEKKAPKLTPVVSPPILRGTIGIVIDDFGYRNDDVSDGFLNLDVPLTYAVIPGHEYSKSFGEKAVGRGFEVIVHMPFENLANKGGEESFVLSTSMDSETIQERVQAALDQIPSAIGMNNHQGSKASADQHVMSNVARVLKKRNLFFVDSRTTAETVAESTMEVYNVPTTRRNIFLDNDDDEGKIHAQLIKLVEKSEELGTAVGIGHVKPKTLKILKKYIPELQKKGYKFEFVSKMLH
ncbi:MAG: divergent polysaccharide deacetylase family protein [Candidatus Neomarinimicrobiota bacterium]|nr:divergent polysaccharide deacetylase family protein [Candidatus Neomarinimicrobiota bacterium]